MAKIAKNLIKHDVTVNKVEGEQQGTICIALGRTAITRAPVYTNTAYLNEDYFIFDDSYTGKHAQFTCVQTGWYTFQTRRGASNNVYIKKNSETVYTFLSSNSFATLKFESGDSLLIDGAAAAFYLCSVYFLTE